MRINLPQLRLPAYQLPWLRVGVGALVLLVVVAAAITGWRLISSHHASQAPASESQEHLTPDGVYLTASDSALNVPLKLSLTAPTSWHTNRLPADPTRLLSGSDYEIASFSFTAGNPDLTPTGQLIIENANSWTAQNDIPGAASLGDLSGTTAKEAYVNYLSKLGNAGTLTPTERSELPMVPQAAGFAQNAQSILSADSKLAGAEYVEIVTANGTSTPHVLANMAGTVNGQTVFARLDLTVAADQNAATSGPLDNATETLYQRAGAVLRSLVLNTSS